MSDVVGPVYVAAIWSVVHGCWCEFVVSAERAKVVGVIDVLRNYCAVHVRVIRVARDDWSLIRPALAALDRPPPAFTQAELELECAARGIESEIYDGELLYAGRRGFDA